MFHYERTVFLSETDATGVLYFSEQFKMAQECMEAYFSSRGFKLQQMIEKSAFCMPIVHATADFSAPVRVGDLLEINLSLGEMGTSSFTLHSAFKDSLRGPVGKVTLVHVVVSKETGKAEPIPETVRALIESLSGS